MKVIIIIINKLLTPNIIIWHRLCSNRAEISFTYLKGPSINQSYVA